MNTVTVYGFKEIEAEDYSRDEMSPKQKLRQHWIFYRLGFTDVMPDEPDPDIEVTTYEVQA